MPSEKHKVGAQPEVEPRFNSPSPYRDAFGPIEPAEGASLSTGLNMRQRLVVPQNRCSLATEYFREEMAEMPLNKV